MKELKEALTRAGWTAVESFLAVIIASGMIDVSISTLQAAAISGVSAALTVVMVWVREKKSSVDKETETMV
jgi:hypothetical protein